MKFKERVDSYLVSNVVGEPVKTLVESFSRGGTSALNVPVIIQNVHS